MKVLAVVALGAATVVALLTRRSRRLAAEADLWREATREPHPGT